MLSPALRPLLLAALSVALAACGRRETLVERGAREGVLRYGNATEPRDLDPSTAISTAEGRLLRELFEGLVDYSPDATRIVPAVAERWEVSPDGRGLTFHLRADARWSNGDPVTSDDFLYSFQRLIEPALGAEQADLADWIVGAREYRTGAAKDFSGVGLRAPDPRTFAITLTARAPFFLGLLTTYPFYPLHRATLEKFQARRDRATAWTRAGNHVSNGPFRLKAWRVNDAVVVERNPSYWDVARVALREVHFLPIDDAESEERAFRGGQLHVTFTIPTTKHDAYAADPRRVLRAEATHSIVHVVFNAKKPPFDDARVRRAFALATDSMAIARQVVRAGNQPANSVSMPGVAGYAARVRFAHDPERARAELAAAGFPGGAGFPKVAYLFPGAPERRPVAEALQAMWQRELGVQVELQQAEEKVWLSAIQHHEHQIAADSWNPTVFDPMEMFSLYRSESPNNDAAWSSAEFDAAFAESTAAPDDAARFEAYQRCDAIYAREAPVIPLYHRSRNRLVHPAVVGWMANPVGVHPLKHIRLEAGAATARDSTPDAR